MSPIARALFFHGVRLALPEASRPALVRRHDAAKLAIGLRHRSGDRRPPGGGMRDTLVDESHARECRSAVAAYRT